MKDTKINHDFSPTVLDVLSGLGRRISSSRRIQRLRQEDLAGMASIGRSTLVEIEKGSPFVSMGHYMSVLWALGLFDDTGVDGEVLAFLPGVSSGMTPDEQRLVITELPKRVRRGR